MARSYLEANLAATLPSFADEWEAHRRAYPPGAAPTDSDFLATCRTHVVSLLTSGRVAETSRFFYSLERLLSEADPILQDLLERDLVRALAAECRAARIDVRRIEPYLGTRSRTAWAGA